MRPLDVGVVGCGSAGGATALLLARAGHRVALFEEAPDPRPIGAGLLLQPTGLSVLARLGLYERLRARGAPVARLRCHGSRGGLVFDLRYGELAPGVSGLGMHRGALFEALWDAVAREPGIRVHTGRPIEGVEQGPAGARLLAGGERTDLFDLVVVADGARSALRDPALVRRVRPYPYGALWVVADAHEGVAQDELAQTAGRRGRFVGLLPTGLGPGDGPARPLVSLFWSLRSDALADWRSRGLDAWKRDVTRLDARAAPVVEPIRSPDEVLFATYWDVVLAPLHRGRVVYVGDAGHAMSPQLGQGANLALVDAWTLAASLDAEPDDLSRALEGYSRARHAPLRYYQLVSRLLTPLFQGEGTLATWAREIGITLAARLGPLRRRMVRTLCGIERGLLRSPERLDPLGTRSGDPSG